MRPSRQLLRHAAEELEERSQFTLLDEQRVAYDLVFHAVEQARTSDHKRVVVVQGGPAVDGASLLNHCCAPNTVFTISAICRHCSTRLVNSHP